MEIPPRLGLTAGPRPAFLLAFPCADGGITRELPACVFFTEKNSRQPKNATTDYSKLVTGLQQIDKK